MRHTPLRAGIALLVLGTLAGAAAAQDVPGVNGRLDIRRVRARFAEARRTAEPRHSLRLAIRLDPAFLPDLHDSDAHALRIRLDGVVLCDAEARDDGYRTLRRGRWVYRGTAAGGRVRVLANGRTGMLNLIVTRADLGGLVLNPAVDLPLTVELAGTTMETEASFRVLIRRVRMWQGLATDFTPDPGPGPGPGPNPDPDPDPDPGDPPVPTKEALLADLAKQSVTFFPDGTATPGGGFDAQNLRCPSGALAAVVPLAVPPPGSADFFTDTAYVCTGSSQYWVHRTGGFAGVSLWLGPFALP